jgi:hypothetical protein
MPVRPGVDVIYNLNFLRFLANFRQKIATFALKNCDPHFAKPSHFFRQSWGRKYLKNHNIGPRVGKISPVGNKFVQKRSSIQASVKFFVDSSLIIK